MRCCLLVLLSAGVLLGCAGDPPIDDIPAPPQAYDAHRFDDMKAGLLRSYLQLQDALAHDEFAVAQQAAMTLAKSSAADLEGLAQTAADAADITAMRSAFRPLSEAIIAADLPADLGIAYCSMAFDYEGARWVQTEGDVSNPYYGATMLRCGAFEEEDGATDDS
jgi:hypothetical protein